MGNLNIFRRSGIRKRVCAALCAAIILALACMPAYSASSAEDLQAQIDKIRKDNQDRSDKIASYGSSITNNEETIKLINEQIDGINEEITKCGQLIITKQGLIDEKKAEIEFAEQSISEKDREIDAKKAEISDLQAQNKRNLEKFAELARALYMADMSSTLPILQGSDSWYNYFVYSDVVKNISAQNLEFMKRLLASIDSEEKMIDDLQADISKLEQDKQELQNKKTELENDMAALEEERSKLYSHAAEQKNYLYKLAADNQELRKKIDGLEYDIAESKRKLEELDKELEELIRKAQEEGKGGQIDYSSDFRWPLDPKFKRITTYYGWDNSLGGRNHGGVDIAGGPYPIGSANIYAVQSGTVIQVVNYCPHDYYKEFSCGCGGGWGNYVVIDHGGEVSTLYAHCRKIFVKKGQQVARGDVIALVGSTGWSLGEHLHLEVRENGKRVDPFKYEYEYYN